MVKIDKKFIIIVLLIAIVLIGYFLYTNQSMLKKENSITQKINCLNYGKENYGLGDQGQFISNERTYFFNKELNTCLMYESLSDTQNNFFRERVVDIINDELLLSYSSNCLDAWDYDESKCLPRSKFIEEKEKLFK